MCFFCYSRTPLHCAVATNQLALVKLLVESGAAIFVTNNNGDTPLELSQDYEDNEQCTKYLKSNYHRILKLFSLFFFFFFFFQVIDSSNVTMLSLCKGNLL